MTRYLTRRSLLVSAFAIAAAACRRQREREVTTVSAELGEFYIEVDKVEVDAGTVRFVARNVGQMEHELIVLRTDLPADQLPYDETEETAKEEEAGEVLGEIEPEDLPPGKTAEMTVEMTPGTYVLLCNIPTHYKLGMYRAFRVR
jgi:uncharacterized cupredoxin-like copper-binding protein